MSSVGELLRSGVERLRASGSESARLDAELLLGHVLGVDRTTILAHPEASVGPASELAYAVSLGRRERGEPVAYIRGFKEFRGLAFSVDSRALIPRPETELAVDIVESEVARRLTAAPRPAGAPPLRVLDAGTGCGTIAVALAVALRGRRMLDEVRIVATDVDEGTLQLARENAVAHAVADRVEFLLADLVPAQPGRFAVVAANLPYIDADEVDRLPIAASFEPRQALDGGSDGLALIGRLLARLPAILEPDGTAVLEIGSDQGRRVRDLVAGIEPAPDGDGWRAEILTDLAGMPRIARVQRVAMGAATTSPEAAPEAHEPAGPA